MSGKESWIRWPRGRALVLMVVLGVAFGVVLFTAGIALAQGQPPQQQQPPPYNPGDTMPASMFYWLVGVVGALLTAMATALKVLWNRLSVPPDNEGIETSLATLATGIETLGKGFQETETRWSTERAELRAEIDRWQERYFRQQTKMEKLAVRTQRAVEAVAGLEVPEVESDLDDVDPG